MSLECEFECEFACHAIALAKAGLPCHSLGQGWLAMPFPTIVGMAKAGLPCRSLGEGWSLRGSLRLADEGEEHFGYLL